MRRANVSKGSREHPCKPACNCELCKAAQQAAARFTTAPGQSVSIDLAGPFKTPTISGCKYAFICVDHYTRYTWVDFMPSKTSKCTSQAFQRYVAHTGIRPQHVHTDGGKEFLGSFSTLLRQHLVKQTYSCPYSSFENSIVERRVRSLKECTR